MGNIYKTYIRGTNKNRVMPSPAEMAQGFIHWDPRTQKHWRLLAFGLTDTLIGTNALGGVVTAASTGTVKVSTNPGYFTMATPATNNDTLLYTDSALSLKPSIGGVRIVDRIKLSEVTAKTFEFGLLDHLTYGSLTEKACFQFSTASAVSATNWLFVVTDGTNTDTIDTGVVASTTEVELRIEVEEDGTVHAFIDDAEVLDADGDGPSVALTAGDAISWYYYNKNLAAAAKTARLGGVDVVTGNA